MKGREFKRVWGKPWDYSYLLAIEQNVNANGGGGEIGDLRTHTAQNLQGIGDVADTGDILQRAHVTHENGGKQDRQRRIFHTADRDLAVKWSLAANHHLCRHNAHGRYAGTLLLPFQKLRADTVQNGVTRSNLNSNSI